MPKQGEIDYIKNLRPEEVHHAVNKPFSDNHVSQYLACMAAILRLLPSRPARLLDLGCGTGWTSAMFARTGYEVVGVDLCPDMIELARKQNRGLDNLQFQVSDYEGLEFEEEFDAVVFYDSLHHAVDEELALRSAYKALKPGGTLLASEPGEGHHDSGGAQSAVERFGVTEKDMPPKHILSLGRKIGFKTGHAFAHAAEVHELFYAHALRVNDEAAKRPLSWFGPRRWVSLLLCRLMGIETRLFPSRDIAFRTLLDGCIQLNRDSNSGLTLLRK